MRDINRVLTLNRSCRVLVQPEKLLELPGRGSFRSIALTHTLHANETIPPGFFSVPRIVVYSRPDNDSPLVYSRGQVRLQLLRNSHEFVLAPLGSLDENHARSHRFRRAFTRHFYREHARIYRNAFENVLIVVALPSARKSTDARTVKYCNSTVDVKKKGRKQNPLSRYEV